VSNHRQGVIFCAVVGTIDSLSLGDWFAVGRNAAAHATLVRTCG
jgi:hypothetical protein